MRRRLPTIVWDLLSKSWEISRKVYFSFSYALDYRSYLPCVAISNQRKYLDMCASNNDGEGQGNACAAIAEALEENGDVQGAIKV